MIVIIISSLFIYNVNSQIPFLGRCNDVQSMEGFDVNKYMGKWYEAERYPAVFEIGGKCVTATYTLQNDGTVEVLNKQISTITGGPTSIKGIARIAGRPDEGKLSVRFPSLPVQFDAPYWILDTDYHNYAVVWSCADFGLFNTLNAWILTRAQNPSPNVIGMVNATIGKLGINRNYFIKTDQESCPQD